MNAADAAADAADGAVSSGAASAGVGRRHFRLKHHVISEGSVSLVGRFEGAQDVQLDLVMNIYTNGRFSGKAIAKIFLYVTKRNF